MTGPDDLFRALGSLIRDRPLIYVDCGARAGRGPKALLRLKRAEYIGIEADAEECARLNARARSRHRYIAAVLGSTTGQQVFRLTRSPSCASLLKPNDAFLDQFEQLRDRFRVEKEIVVETQPLETVPRSHGTTYVDFLELDTQGTELDILTGADRLIEDEIVGVQVEVEFAEMYVNQPLFSDVDPFLRARGFQLIDLSRHCAKRSILNSVVPSRGQLLWGHALYLRREETCRSYEQRARLAVISALWDLPDLAIGILADLSVNASSGRLRRAAEDARNALMAQPAPHLLDRFLAKFGKFKWGFSESEP